MNYSKFLVLPAMTMIMTVPALAATQVNGTVKSLKADKIVLKTEDGKSVSYALAKDVMYMPSKDKIKPGVKVTVYLAADGKTAIHVMTMGSM